MLNSSEPLLERARMAASRAHCPYSQFHVGAAVLCDDGSVIEGCNVENASYGLTVSCVDAQDEAAVSSRMPCGACRQVMQELLPPDADIHVDGVGRRSLQQLLPEAFQLD